MLAGVVCSWQVKINQAGLVLGRGALQSSTLVRQVGFLRGAKNPVFVKNAMLLKPPEALYSTRHESGQAGETKKNIFLCILLRCKRRSAFENCSFVAVAKDYYWIAGLPGVDLTTLLKLESLKRVGHRVYGVPMFFQLEIIQSSLYSDVCNSCSQQRYM